MGEGVDEVVDGVDDLWLSDDHTDVRVIVIGDVVCHDLDKLLHGRTDLRWGPWGPLIKHLVCSSLCLCLDLIGILTVARCSLCAGLRCSLGLRLGLCSGSVVCCRFLGLC